ncbi:AraC family transcriptional regulator [Cohnella herbarum]|uniref:AraC family transcriptional regulator n=1 Tax=Cohnella herbarum TaxID=2728023 RepID=A0A7Z2ZPX6_9BACL|nr:AraC family transcriptional regulator [Cohnella herbarum]QJD87365.1 AraC family transcriptional regulator [Cohnella herbarum]
MDSSIRTGQKNSVTEQFIPDLKATHHISFLHVREVNSDWIYPSHEHKQHEINYVMKGSQVMSINGKAYRQQAGDFVLIRPGDIHSSKVGAAEGLTYLCLHFEIDDRPLLHLLRSTPLSLIPGTSQDGKAMQTILERLAALVLSEQRFVLSVRALVQSLFYEVIAQLCLTLSTSIDNQDDGRPPHSETAHRIEAFIQAAAKQPIYHGQSDQDRLLIGQIAQKLGISESHCNRLFKKVYGISPRQYLSRMIQDEATRLLGDTDLSIDHISNLLGYADIAHFSRQFKRWTGESPRRYRDNKKDSTYAYDRSQP